MAAAGMAINDDGKSWAATGTATAGWTASGIDGDGGLGGGRYTAIAGSAKTAGRQCGFGATAGGWTAAGVGDGGLDGGRYGDGRLGGDRYGDGRPGGGKYTVTAGLAAEGTASRRRQAGRRGEEAADMATAGCAAAG